MENHTIGNRYRVLSRLGEGGMGEVFRVSDRLTGDILALKRVTLDTPENDETVGTTLNVRLALAQEFKVLASLRHPNIISVLDYGFDDGKPFFTMEYLKDAQDLVTYATGRSQTEKLHLLVQLLQALNYLHRRGIIHRDVKPDNVMVVNDSVKVLDFGLAAARNQLEANEETAVGTVAYMSPEVLQGKLSTEASDLFAVGIIGYEMLAEEHPFDISNFSDLIRAIASASPDIDSLDINSELREVFFRLFERQPVHRYNNARQVIHDIDDALTQPMGLENENIRESYLQAAQFVGRDEEIDTLMSALRNAMDNRGSGILIGGESGVGKTRLMDEIRTQALVAGAQVLRGTAVAEGGAPYQIWLNVLRQLALQTTLTDLEASVLRDITPDIAILIERDVKDSPDVDGDSAQSRLLNILENIFERQQQPILMLLDDIQWCGEESLAVLERIGSIAHNNAIFILASHRSDEAPHLPTQLTHLYHLPLSRLSREDIHRLSASMIGTDNVRDTVVELLERETEGNVFFIVEVMRALAEEAGDVESIGARTLPPTVFAGGVYAVVQSRLRNLPSDAQTLVRIAAIGGKVVDPQVLQVIYPSLDVEQWLLLCSDASVLEIENNEWRFVHDKLRDAATENLNPTQKRQLHRLLAIAIETVYGSDDARQYAKLAYHYERAVNAPDADVALITKAITYLNLAGKQALESSSYLDCIRNYERIFVLDGIRERHLTELNNSLEGMDKQTISDTQRAGWHFTVSLAHGNLHRFDRSRHHLEKASDLYGYPMPESQIQLTLGILWQFVVQVMHRLVPSLFLGRAKADEYENLLAVARTDQSAGTLYFVSHQPIRSLYTTLHSINISEKAGQSAELAQAYAQMCTLTGNMNLQSAADAYYKQAVEVASKLNDPRTSAETLFIASIYHTGACHFDIVEHDLQEAIRLYKEVGALFRWGYSIITMGTNYATQGRYDEAYERYQFIRDNSDTPVPQHSIMSCAYQGRVDMIRGKTELALRRSSQALDLLELHHDSLDDPSFPIYPLTEHAAICVANGRYEEAYQYAREASEITQEMNVTASLGFVAYATLAKVYLQLSELDDHKRPNDKSDLLGHANTVLKALDFLTPPAGKPAKLRHLAWHNFVLGKKAKAYKQWQASADLAHDLGMAYDEGMAYKVWGLHLPEDDPERITKLEKALKILTTIGAMGDIAEIRIALQPATKEFMALTTK